MFHTYTEHIQIIIFYVLWVFFLKQTSQTKQTNQPNHQKPNQTKPQNKQTQVVPLIAEQIDPGFLNLFCLRLSSLIHNDVQILTYNFCHVMFTPKLTCCVHFFWSNKNHVYNIQESTALLLNLAIIQILVQSYGRGNVGRQT